MYSNRPHLHPHHIICNSSSMARDQFAAERNFLSWVKLSMAVVASGALVFRDFPHSNKLASITTLYFMCLSCLLLVVSALYVNYVQKCLADEHRPVKLFRPLFLQIVGSILAISLTFVLAIEYY